MWLDIRKTAALIILIGAMGVCVVSVKAEAGSGDPWKKEPDTTTLYTFPLAEENVVPVHKAVLDEALALLDKNAFLPMNEAEGAHYMGTRLDMPENAHMYLVRGLTLAQASGKYKLYYSQGALLVSYWMLGRTDPPVKHDALIVVLPDELKDLYVTYHVAE